MTPGTRVRVLHLSYSAVPVGTEGIVAAEGEFRPSRVDYIFPVMVSFDGKGYAFKSSELEQVTE